MKHCILAKFRPEAGDWRAYLPQIRTLMSEAAALAVPLEVGIGVGENWDEAH